MADIGEIDWSKIEIDWSKIRHWQVMDPAPEFIQKLDDPIIVAQIMKAQIEFKKNVVQAEMKATMKYYDDTAKILDGMIQKQSAK